MSGCNAQGGTPLHDAAQRGHLEITKVRLDLFCFCFSLLSFSFSFSRSFSLSFLFVFRILSFSFVFLVSFFFSISLFSLLCLSSLSHPHTPFLFTLSHTLFPSLITNTHNLTIFSLSHHLLHFLTQTLFNLTRSLPPSHTHTHTSHIHQHTTNSSFLTLERTPTPLAPPGHTRSADQPTWCATLAMTQAACVCCSAHPTTRHPLAAPQHVSAVRTWPRHRAHRLLRWIPKGCWPVLMPS